MIQLSDIYSKTAEVGLVEVFMSNYVRCDGGEADRMFFLYMGGFSLGTSSHSPESRLLR